MPLTRHVWTTITRVPKFPMSTYLYAITDWGTTGLSTIYVNIPNHSWNNTYDWGCTKNTLTTLCTMPISLYWSVVLNLPRTNYFYRRIGSRSNAYLLLRSSICIRFLYGNTRQKPAKRLRTNILTYLIILKFTNYKTLFYIYLLVRSWLTYSSNTYLVAFAPTCMFNE